MAGKWVNINSCVAHLLKSSLKLTFSRVPCNRDFRPKRPDDRRSRTTLHIPPRFLKEAPRIGVGSGKTEVVDAVVVVEYEGEPVSLSLIMMGELMVGNAEIAHDRSPGLGQLSDERGCV